MAQEPRAEAPAGEPRVVLLGFAGCPHTPELRSRLGEALQGTGVGFEEQDLESLPAGDSRRGFPAPTVLVNGRDLFGMTPTGGGALRCRVYPGGLPTVASLAASLRDRGVKP